MPLSEDNQVYRKDTTEGGVIPEVDETSPYRALGESSFKSLFTFSLFWCPRSSSFLIEKTNLFPDLSTSTTFRTNVITNIAL